MQTTTPLSRSQRLHKIENTVTLFVYYGLPIIAIAILIYAMFSAQNIGFKYQERRGQQGFNLLILILFIKPISILGRKYIQARLISGPQSIEILKDIVHSNTKKPKWFTIIKDLFRLFIDGVYSLSSYLMRFRKQLGIACFRFLLIHGGLSQISRLRADLPLFYNINEPKILVGILSLLAIFLGAITSNMRSIKTLKDKWKKIQMIAAYTAFGFACIHTGQILTLIIYAILKYHEEKETRGKIYNRIQQKKDIIITKGK